MPVTIAQSGSATGTATLTVTLDANTAVDDLIYVMQLTNLNAAHQTNPSSAGTWTTVGTQAQGTNASIRVWSRRATVAGSQAITMGGSYSGTGGHEMVVVNCRGVTTADPAVFSVGTATTSFVLTGVTASGPGVLLALYGGKSTSATASAFTHPASMIELQDLAGALRMQAGAAYEVLAAGGATGTRTVGTSVAYNSGGVLIALQSAATPVSGSFLPFF